MTFFAKNTGFLTFKWPSFQPQVEIRKKRWDTFQVHPLVDVCRSYFVNILNRLEGDRILRKPYLAKIQHMNIVFFRFCQLGQKRFSKMFSRVIDPTEFENGHEKCLRGHRILSTTPLRTWVDLAKIFITFLSDDRFFVFQS